MRLYFHLRDKDELLPDRHGVEVADLQQAQALAIRTIKELRQEDPSTARHWSGWTLTIADESGAVLFALDLDREIP